MKKCWKQILALEHRMQSDHAAKQLHEDLDFLKCKPLRLTFCFFERDRWKHDSSAGRKMLSGLLKVLPDSKIVEDLHGNVRNDAGANRTRKLSMPSIFDIVTRSHVFKERNIKHNCSVEKRQFCNSFKGCKFLSARTKYMCSAFLMKPHWMKMLKPRSWKPLTEEHNHKSQAALQWMQQRLGNEGMRPIQLGMARLSKLVPPYVVIHCKQGETDKFYASLGNATWGALGWPLVQLTEGIFRLDVREGSGAEWFHVTNISDWHVVPVAGKRYLEHTAVVLSQTGESMPLLRYCLKTQTRDLSLADLLLCAEVLGIVQGGEGRAPPRDHLLSVLSPHYGDEFVKEDKQRAAHDMCMANDPLAEAVYQDMDHDDKQEFPEVQDMLLERNAHQRVSHYRFLKAQACANETRKRKAKGRKPGPVKRRRVVSEPEAGRAFNV
jgi:hypothetical protein